MATGDLVADMVSGAGGFHVRFAWDMVMRGGRAVGVWLGVLVAMAAYLGMCLLAWPLVQQGSSMGNVG